MEFALTDFFHAVQKQADLHPDAAALSSVDGKSVLSYQQLLRSGEAAAAWLRAQGVQAGDCLALRISPSSVLHGIFLLAALRAGALVATLGNRPGAEWAALEVLSPRLLSVDADKLPFVDTADWLSVSATDVQSFLRTQGVFGLPAAADMASTAGLVLFGGAAGAVCAVKLPVARLVPRLRVLAERLQLEPGRRLSLALPASAPLGLELAMACWLAGGCVVHPTSVPQLRMVLQSGSDDVALSSQVLHELLGASDEPVQAARAAPSRRVFVVGGPLSLEVAALARQRLLREPHLLMSSAETGLFSVGTKADLAARIGCVGRPAGAADVQAVDARGHVRPVAQDGLLRVTTPWMAASYVQDTSPILPTDISGLRDGWWLSGLRGSIAADGRISISGVLAPAGHLTDG